MTGASPDPTALSWCLGEIRESLARAETALEQQLRDGEGDDGRLRAARGWVHQAQGALQIVDLEGVAVLVQEAEGLLDRAGRGELRFGAELVRTLSRAFAATVDYLEGVVAGSGDSPVALFPHYRELLELRGADRIEPADLFAVDLTVRPPRATPGAPLSDDETARLRGAFETGLLRFLRNPRDGEALEAMHGAVARFSDAHAASGARSFWWLATAFLDALRVQALPVDVYAKRLVGRVNRQVARSLVETTPIADRLLRDLLFMLARTGAGSALADEARERWRLTGTVPSDFETPRYAVVDARTLRAAREATASAKAAWEKYVRGSAQDLPAFAQAAQQLDAAVARLPWPGLQKLSSVLVGLRRALAAAGSNLAEVLSLEVATALLFVEQALERGARAVAQHDRRAVEMSARLDRLTERQELDASPPPEWLAELSRAAQERLTTAAFVGEMQANLRACEKALDAYFRDPGAQRDALPALASPLRQVAGALRLLGHDDAAEGAATVLRQVDAFAGDEAPQAADCERVAASLGAIGFFVESLRQGDRGHGGFEFRRDADAFVARLGDHGRADDAETAGSLRDAAPVDGPSPESTALVASALEPPPTFDGAADARGSDASALDGETIDIGTLDGETLDIGTLDIGTLDIGTLDIGTPDIGTPDIGTPGVGAPDIGTVEVPALGTDPSDAQPERSRAGGPGAASPEGIASGGDALDIGELDIGELDIGALRVAPLEPPGVAGAPVGDGFVGLGLDFDVELPTPAGDETAEAFELDADRSLEQLLDERRARLPALLDALRDAPADATRRAALHDALGAIRDEAMLLDDGELRGHAADALARLDGGADPASPPLADAVARVVGGVAAEIVAVALPDDDALDAELLGIFLDEADEVLAAIESAAAELRAAPADAAPLTTIRRGFHTLKGSSRMVGLGAFGEAAWSVEQVLNGWLADQRPGTPALHALVADARAELSDWVFALRGDPRARIDPEPVIARAVALRDAPAGGAAASPPASAADTNRDPSPTIEPSASIDDPFAIDLDAADLPPLGGDAGAPPDDVLLDADPLSLDVPTLAMPLEPEAAVVDPAPAARDAAGDPASPPDDDLLELTEVFDPEALEVPTLSALDAVEPVGAAPAADETIEIGGRTLNAQLHRIFVDEAAQILAVIDAAVDGWRRDASRLVPEPLPRAVHSLVGTSRLVGLASVQHAAGALEDGLRDLAAAGRGPEAAELDDVAWVAARLDDALRAFGAGRDPGDDAVLIDRARAFAASAAAARPSAPSPRDDDAFDLADVDAALGLDLMPIEPVARGEPPPPTEPARAGPPTAPPRPAPPRPAPVAQPAPVASRTVAPAAAAATRPASGSPLDSLAALVDDIDAELVGDFVEEADELLPRIGDALRAWSAQPGDPAHPAALMRLLHTVKGSARMAGAMRLGHVVHDMEARIESASALSNVPPALVDDLIARHDQVLTLYEAVRDPRSEAAQAAARRVVESLSGPSADVTAAPDAAPVPAASAAADAAGAAPQAAAVAQPPSLIRVRADLLDRLVNEAGEVSIARARLDNELGGLRQSLGELTENVNRLRTQLREIELAADSQIDARSTRDRERDVQFDPLEFDRYTRFQELTRMLAESVNDVATVQQNALRSLDEANRDLARQTQVTRDLQQDLMRIRMVQFGSIADRLYRVVRQSAKELDKRVSLDLRGATAELDRGVLERMAGPIEHLLRNAVAHGIEPRAERLAAGKAETGEITLEVRQEGNEVILTFADDGAGLNYTRIRQRAIERRLIAPDAHPGERELGDLIFMPGFSTAPEVTAIAGRGVGMDVVRAEVAAMGGRIDLESIPGRGTRFTVHLPVSLAVAQVVLLTVGPMRIAVTSALIEQVMQLKPEALAGAYSNHAIDWHGQAVPLYYLGSLLDLADCTPLAQRYSPVVIVRSGAQRIALHVDHVAPSQEVVVKHVGPQLARLTGMAGATVLGNGDIVLILNPVQIAATGRGPHAGEGDTASFAPTRIEIAPTVMVVDDSVTVRKVTQRLLAREGYQVMLAKDGLDALRQLQDTVPDVLLLDIEMPRMDGFELTKNLRGDERWKHLPIVMITSRTAEKHRSHAMSLGVDAFLGKPYDEDELLRLLAGFAQRRQQPG
ncbi:MAG: hypothetical protein RJA99_3436 [Pseudomonadota bacterium]